MKILFLFSLLAFGFVFSLWRWGGMEQSVTAKWEAQLGYERQALALLKKNQALEAEVSTLKFRVSELESKNKFLSANRAAAPERAIASIPRENPEDLVKFDVYKWTPEKLLAIGQKEFHYRNYEKSAQFYNELLSRYPKHQLVSDRVLFGAGVAAYESGKRYEWTEKYLERLVKTYPKSDLYRDAKLWLALAQYNQGQHQKFLATVEEFRLKYRNTDQWKILSRYYEDIAYKVKK